MKTKPANTVDDETIYNAYRLTLRALKKSSSERGRHDDGLNRAGSRKQIALKTVSDRYHVRVRDVVRIVKKGDAAAGVEHEHDHRYLFELELSKRIESVRKELADDPSCQICGTTDHDALIRVRYFEGEESVRKTCFPCYFRSDSISIRDRARSK